MYPPHGHHKRARRKQASSVCHDSPHEPPLPRFWKLCLLYTQTIRPCNLCLLLNMAPSSPLINMWTEKKKKGKNAPTPPASTSNTKTKRNTWKYRVRSKIWRKMVRLLTPTKEDAIYEQKCTSNGKKKKNAPASMTRLKPARSHHSSIDPVYRRITLLCAVEQQHATAGADEYPVELPRKMSGRVRPRGKPGPIPLYFCAPFVVPCTVGERIIKAFHENLCPLLPVRC